MKLGFSVKTARKTAGGLAVLMAFSMAACAPKNDGANSEAAQASAAAVKSAQAAGDAVADWQLANLNDLYYVERARRSSENTRGWVQAAFYVGLQRYAEAAGSDRYQAAVLDWAESNDWKQGERLFHADDHAVGRVYTRLRALGLAGEEATAFVEADFSLIKAAAPKVSLDFETPRTSMEDMRICQLRWCWADAIFMAPPAWLALANVTGDASYRQFADEEFWATTDYLFDWDLGLYYRDSKYFERKGEHDEAVFWSRGNGWVFAGLVDMIALLPEDHPQRRSYIKVFRAMADALKALQRTDGYWTSSLLAPQAAYGPETSGTAFFVYGLAEGVRQDLIKDEDYGENIERGWDALLRAQRADGRIGYVQQIGQAPAQVSEDSTQIYGSGAFLLAAAAMIERGD